MDSPCFDRPLSDAEEAYVFAHLGQFVKADVPLSEVLNWPRSDAPLRTDFAIDGIPVLFPGQDFRPEPFVVEGGRVVVCHDFVKSAFCLLSAWQEWHSDVRDEGGRFPYAGSLQERLGVAHRPVVNYYFEWMVAAIERQCELSGLRCETLSPIGGASLLLSHDVDQVSYFTWRRSFRRLAQVLGLRPCDTSRRRLARAAVVSLLNMMRLRHDANPYWSFDAIQDNEAYIGYKSAWFFSPDNDFPNDEALLKLIETLSSRGNRVGLLAPMSCRDSEAYLDAFERLIRVSPRVERIVRQHSLAVGSRGSFRAMSDAGFYADFAFGFSDHEGFRNSYCFPFRPFDHERQCEVPVVVVPLAMTDSAVLGRRSLSYDDIFLATGEMLDEVRRFGGVFSCSWRNSAFDETYHPGVGKFFEDLHLFFSQYQMRDFLRWKGWGA